MIDKVKYFFISALIGAIVYFFLGLNFIIFIGGIILLFLLCNILKSLSKYDALLIGLGFISGMISMKIIGSFVFWTLIIIVLGVVTYSVRFKDSK